MSERRNTQRHQVLRRARIVFPGGHCSLGCVLLNMSPEGARLRTDEWLTMPESFSLWFDDGQSRKAQVCYRDMGTAGIRFTDTVAA